jgi:hypothetical protein
MAAAPVLPSLGALHDRHRGEACFIVGNGPSLGRVRLPALRGRLFFGVNRGYLAYAAGLPEIPYYVFVDPTGYARLASEVRAAPVGLRFYRSDVCGTPAYATAADREPAVELTFHPSPCMDEGHFATRLEQGLYRGFTVVTDAVQIAFHMGFAEVYLVGCDLSYAGTATHFYPTGPYEESRRHDMPVSRVCRAFETARLAFEADGRRLVNVTPGSALDTLPLEDFETVIRRLRPRERC